MGNTMLRLIKVDSNKIELTVKKKYFYVLHFVIPFYIWAFSPLKIVLLPFSTCLSYTIMFLSPKIISTKYTKSKPILFPSIIQRLLIRTVRYGCKIKST